MLRSKALCALLTLLLFSLFLSACGSESGGGNTIDIDEDTGVTGSILLPDGVVTDGEYPVTVQAFYTDDCTEEEPDAVFSGTGGDYDITVNCGSDGKVFLVYASRTGDYGLISQVTEIEGQVGGSISSSVTLLAMAPASVNITVAQGFDGAYDHVDLQFGLYAGNVYDTIPVDSMHTYDGNPVFADHRQQLSGPGMMFITRAPIGDWSGRAHSVTGQLIGSYTDGAETVQGSLLTRFGSFYVEAGGDNSRDLEFEDTTSFLGHSVNFTTNGVYDPEPYRASFTRSPYTADNGAMVSQISLGQIPYRQDIFHLTLVFMDNLSVSVDGQPFSSGETVDVDLSVKPLEDVVIDVLNTVSGESETYIHTFYSDSMSDQTDLLLYYRIDSEIRGIYTTISNPHIFKSTPYSSTYDVFVDYTVNEVDLTFTKTDPLQILTINGVIYPETTQFNETRTRLTVPVVDGDNVFELDVAAEDPEVTGEYLLTIVRSKSDNADLRTLSLTSNFQELLPPFSPETTIYVATTENEFVKLIANAYAGSTMHVVLNDEELGTAPTQFVQNLALAEGLNILTIDVTSADETTTKQYTIEITRGPTDCIPNSDLPCGPAS